MGCLEGRERRGGEIKYEMLSTKDLFSSSLKHKHFRKERRKRVLTQMVDRSAEPESKKK